ncbi:MAG: NACHT domain-containing protein, partial [Caldilineaceae bacterium]|nr:NACHT domain-containing protein [Caldilineaceae bacterium]
MSEDPQTDAQARIAELERQLAQAEAKLAKADQVAAGQGQNVTAGGDMADNTIVTGDGNITIIAEQVSAEFVRALQSTQLSESDLQAATQAYIQFLLTRFRYLDFRGMGMADRVALQLPLTAMYVPLKARQESPRGETWAREMMVAGRKAGEAEAMAMGEKLGAPQPLLDLMARQKGLVILGDPGAGKTTFLKYLAMRLALGQGDAMQLGGRLPILVPLSAYANAIAEHDVSLQEFLGDYYRNQGVEIPVGALVDALLASGKALVMFDGLDEVQAQQQRTLVVDRVERFFAFHSQRGNKFLLTSRIVGYRDVRLNVDGLIECTLVDFDDDDIEDFVGKWSGALEQASQGAGVVSARNAAQEADELLFAVGHNPGVRRLASNPLLLTILALMKR